MRPSKPRLEGQRLGLAAHELHPAREAQLGEAAAGRGEHLLALVDPVTRQPYRPASSAATAPVPVATSSTRSPGRGRTRAARKRCQRGSWPRLRIAPARVGGTRQAREELLRLRLGRRREAQLSTAPAPAGGGSGPTAGGAPELGEDAEERLAQVLPQLGVGDPHRVEQVAEPLLGLAAVERGEAGLDVGLVDRGQPHPRQQRGRVLVEGDRLEDLGHLVVPALAEQQAGERDARADVAGLARDRLAQGRLVALAHEAVDLGRHQPVEERLDRGRRLQPDELGDRVAVAEPFTRGMLITRYAWARFGLASMSTFASTSAPSRRSTACSRMG